MKIRAFQIMAGLATGWLVGLPTALQGAPISFEQQVKPVLVEFCYDCHGDGSDKGDVRLDAWTSPEAMTADTKLWEAVMNNVQGHVMPPPKKPQPSPDQRDLIAEWVESQVFKVDCLNPDPGRVTIRRLNRAEYNNTIRDLIGIDFTPADGFPEDDSGYGYDNIGDVLSVSTLHLEKYLMAAREILNRAIVSRPPAPENRPVPEGKWRGGDGGVLASTGEIAADLEFPQAGKYRIRVEAYGDQAGPDPVKMAYRYGGKEEIIEIPEKSRNPRILTHEVQADKGTQTLKLAFLNDYYKTDGPQKDRGDRNLHVDSIEIVGPLDLPPPAPSEIQKRIIFKQPDGGNNAVIAREIIERFAFRAYRRPPLRSEVDRLMKLYFVSANEPEVNFEEAIKMALEAVLVSPNFLFRGELQPEPDNPQVSYYIRDHSLASRLSYFIWSSMPDEELFAQANRGTLRKNLEDQVRRMLRDNKAMAMADNFAAQWLQTRNLDLVTVSKKDFPGFDDDLKAAMKEETRQFFRYIQREDRSILEFLNADYTFVNERLARHYGLDGVKGSQFQKVSLANTQRRGVLTQGSVLTITSNPTRTSPVKRGLFVLENLLATPPPRPPADVPPFDESKEAALKGTLRERFEAHRDKPICRSCHERMDPLGFGLENFDAVGRWRDHEGKFPVDASGKLVSGEEFQKPLELFQILSTDKRDQFVRCLIEQMLTFALGRGVEHYDRCAIDRIQERLEKNNYRFSELVLGIAESVPFQMRRGEGQR